MGVIRGIENVDVPSGRPDPTSLIIDVFFRMYLRNAEFKEMRERDHLRAYPDAIDYGRHSRHRVEMHVRFDGADYLGRHRAG